MSDDGPVAQAQAALGAIAFELLALQERLAAINRSLPILPTKKPCSKTKYRRISLPR